LFGRLLLLKGEKADFRRGKGRRQRAGGRRPKVLQVNGGLACDKMTIKSTELQ
jgi:hypothetical protein